LLLPNSFLNQELYKPTREFVDKSVSNEWHTLSDWKSEAEKSA